MQNNQKIVEIGNLLPFGSKKEIYRRTGITEKTISHFFRLKTKYHHHTYISIMKEAVKIIKDEKLKPKNVKEKKISIETKQLEKDILDLINDK
ncbi:hypothetical protein ACFSKN_08165 [Mariniflexile gromovii]|uniref:Uncharacterized protein n=1 Tax=Mariniflexile gromovii TaxID=362523 RepID=A0ABS4BUB0_9FLAO|nr:hypothetical protein [Mariniflexile gromovii]MBP0904174.1 hypothetical protein [Mariniflexile gromovii]